MLKIAVIGCGNRSYLVENAFLFPEVKLVAAADPSKTSLEKFLAAMKERHKQDVIPYSDYQSMLAQETLDAVLITSPDHVHEEQALACLARGIAVYLEKPLAITIDSCDRILQFAKERRGKIQIGHNMRYMWFTNKMKEIIDSGVIGDVSAIWVRHFVSYGDGYFFKWYSEREKTNSLLVQKGAHDIDIIHMLAGARTSRVSGYGKLSVYNTRPCRAENEPEFLYRARTRNWPPQEMKGYNPKMNVNDHNMILMQLENGVQASYMQCFYTPDTCRNYTVIGTHGRLENYGDFGVEGCRIQVWTNRMDQYRQEGDITYREPPQNSSGHGGGDANIIGGFIRYVMNAAPPVIRPQDARYAAAVGICGAESIRNGNLPVDIPRLDPELEQYSFY